MTREKLAGGLGFGLGLNGPPGLTLHINGLHYNVNIIHVYIT